MEAIRQTIKVINHKISITLPDDFNANEVDVIILPSQNDTFSITQWQIDQVRERSAEYHKNPSIGLDFDEVMKEIEDEI
jgi:peroxiredoxin